MRDDWKKAGWITVTLNAQNRPTNITVTAYGNKAIKGYVAFADEIKAAAAAAPVREIIYDGSGNPIGTRVIGTGVTLTAGTAEGAAFYLFTNSAGLADWITAGLVTKVTEGGKVVGIHLTDLGKKAVPNMNRLGYDLLAIGLKGGGYAEGLASQIFMDNTLLLNWWNHGWIVVVVDNATMRPIDILLTNKGKIEIPQHYETATSSLLVKDDLTANLTQEQLPETQLLSTQENNTENETTTTTYENNGAADEVAQQAELKNELLNAPDNMFPEIYTERKTETLLEQRDQ
jgi:hypothetical protein